MSTMMICPMCRCVSMVTNRLGEQCGHCGNFQSQWKPYKESPDVNTADYSDLFASWMSNMPHMASMLRDVLYGQSAQVVGALDQQTKKIEAQAQGLQDIIKECVEELGKTVENKDLIQLTRNRSNGQVLNRNEFIDLFGLNPEYVLSNWYLVTDTAKGELGRAFRLEWTDVRGQTLAADQSKVYRALQRIATDPKIWVDRYGDETPIAELKSGHLKNILDYMRDVYARTGVTLEMALQRDQRLQYVLLECFSRKIQPPADYVTAWLKVLKAANNPLPLSKHPQEPVMATQKKYDDDTDNEELDVMSTIKDTSKEIGIAMAKGGAMAVIGEGNQQARALLVAKFGEQFPMLKTEAGGRAIEAAIPALMLYGMDLFPSAPIPKRNVVRGAALLASQEAGRAGAEAALKAFFELFWTQLAPVFTAYATAGEMLINKDTETVDFQAEKDKAAAHAG